ncbi:Sterile alpha motif/pointed domain [Ceraceosorus bombacis]|uniref:Sterile alpha motif/pointed domain n=1 Tax=Ceraceosorus bombacis TaxID=401625 RepID=A0A0P1BPV6_9BASI|nr:Sterile alpha motif/pointed domain [Ceraceosorus bombacis]
MIHSPPTNPSPNSSAPTEFPQPYSPQSRTAPLHKATTTGFNPGGPVPHGYSYLTRSHSLVTPTRRLPKGMQQEAAPAGSPTLQHSASRTSLDSDRAVASDLPSQTGHATLARSNTVPSALVSQTPTHHRAVKDMKEVADELPSNPKTWTSSHVAYYLTPLLHLVPAPIVQDRSSITGRIFLRLREEDLESYGLNPRWRKLILEAGKKLRRDCLKGRLWSVPGPIPIDWPRDEEAHEAFLHNQEKENAAKAEFKGKHLNTLRRLKDKKRVTRMIREFESASEESSASAAEDEEEFESASEESCASAAEDEEYVALGRPRRTRDGHGSGERSSSGSFELHPDEVPDSPRVRLARAISQKGLVKRRMESFDSLRDEAEQQVARRSPSDEARSTIKPRRQEHIAAESHVDDHAPQSLGFNDAQRDALVDIEDESDEMDAQQLHAILDTNPPSSLSAESESEAQQGKEGQTSSDRAFLDAVADVMRAYQAEQALEAHHPAPDHDEESVQSATHAYDQRSSMRKEASADGSDSTAFSIESGLSKFEESIRNRQLSEEAWEAEEAAVHVSAPEDGEKVLDSDTVKPVAAPAERFGATLNALFPAPAPDRAASEGPTDLQDSLDPIATLAPSRRARPQTKGNPYRASTYAPEDYDALGFEADGSEHGSVRQSSVNLTGSIRFGTARRSRPPPPPLPVPETMPAPPLAHTFNTPAADDVDALKAQDEVTSSAPLPSGHWTSSGSTAIDVASPVFSVDSQAPQEQTRRRSTSAADIIGRGTLGRKSALSLSKVASKDAPLAAAASGMGLGFGKPLIRVPLTTLDLADDGKGSIKKRSMVLVERRKFETLAKQMGFEEADLQNIQGVPTLSSSSAQREEEEALVGTTNISTLCIDEKRMEEEGTSGSKSASASATLKSLFDTPTEEEKKELERTNKEAVDADLQQTHSSPPSTPSTRRELDEVYAYPYSPAALLKRRREMNISTRFDTAQRKAGDVVGELQETFCASF